jgi:hypothetical protein
MIKETLLPVLCLASLAGCDYLQNKEDRDRLIAENTKLREQLAEKKNGRFQLRTASFASTPDPSQRALGVLVDTQTGSMWLLKWMGEVMMYGAEELAVYPSRIPHKDHIILPGERVYRETYFSLRGKEVFSEDTLEAEAVTDTTKADKQRGPK